MRFEGDRLDHFRLNTQMAGSSQKKNPTPPKLPGENPPHVNPLSPAGTQGYIIAAHDNTGMRKESVVRNIGCGGAGAVEGSSSRLEINAS